MGDFDVKVGNKGNGEIIGTFGLETRNECGEKWFLWCPANT